MQKEEKIAQPSIQSHGQQKEITYTHTEVKVEIERNPHLFQKHVAPVYHWIDFDESDSIETHNTQ